MEEWVDPYDTPESEKRRIRDEHARATRPAGPVGQGAATPADFADALKRNDRRGFMAMLERAGHPDDNPEFQGITLLHYAVMQKRDWAVEALLKKGADPNLITLLRRTALDIALGSSTPAAPGLIAILKAHGAKKSEDLSLAFVQNQLEARYENMVAAGAVDLPLARGILRAHPQKTRGFIDDFAMRHAGDTPLHRAVTEGRADLVRFWLEQGIPPERPNAQGQSARVLAANNKTLSALFAAPAAPEGGWLGDETMINVPASATLSTLRQTSGAASGDTLLHRIARFGKAADIVNTALNTSGDILKLEDLTSQGPAGRSVLRLLAERGQAEELLGAGLWAGRQKDLTALLAHVKDWVSPQSAERLLREADVQGLRQQAKKNGLKLKFRDGEKNGP